MGRSALSRRSSFQCRRSRWVRKLRKCSHEASHVTTGILTALTQPNPDALRDAIRETRRKSDKPFGVNITLLPTINPPDYEGFARAAIAEGVRIFETAGNNRS
jgi:hypothetical protein